MEAFCGKRKEMDKKMETYINTEGLKCEYFSGLPLICCYNCKNNQSAIVAKLRSDCQRERCIGCFGLPEDYYARNPDIKKPKGYPQKNALNYNGFEFKETTEIETDFIKIEEMKI